MSALLYNGYANAAAENVRVDKMSAQHMVSPLPTKVYDLFRERDIQSIAYVYFIIHNSVLYMCILYYITVAR